MIACVVDDSLGDVVKNCPYCAEEIQDAAVKCRFCGEMLDSTAHTPEQPSQLGPERREEIEERIAQVNTLLAEGKKKDAILLAESLHAQLLSAKEVNPYIQEKKKTVEEALSALGAPVRGTATRRFIRTLLVMLAIPLLVAVAYKLRVNARYESYKKLAVAALADLERLEAATESGITYAKYGDRLGEINYSVKLLTEYRESYASARSLIESQKDFERAKMVWGAKIELDSRYDRRLILEADEAIQLNWEGAGDHLAAAKKELAAGN